MFWRAVLSFLYKVSRPAQSRQAMPSKYRPKRRMRAGSLATPSPEFLLPTSWRRESRSHLQPRHLRRRGARLLAASYSRIAQRACAPAAPGGPSHPCSTISSPPRGLFEAPIASPGSSGALHKTRSRRPAPARAGGPPLGGRLLRFTRETRIASFEEVVQVPLPLV